MTLFNKKLKSLDEHNSHAREFYTSLMDSSPIPNGIACPNCKEELFDTNPMSVLTSNPPQKNVHCKNCDYKGYRVA